MAHNIISAEERGFANQDHEITEPAVSDINPSRHGSSSPSITNDSDNSQKVTEELKCKTERVCNQLPATEELALMRQMDHACKLLDAFNEPQHETEPGFFSTLYDFEDDFEELERDMERIPNETERHLYNQTESPNNRTEHLYNEIEGIRNQAQPTFNQPTYNQLCDFLRRLESVFSVSDDDDTISDCSDWSDWLNEWRE